MLSLFIRNPGAIHYVRMKRKFNLHDGSRLSALTACDYAFTNLTPGWSISLTYAAGSCDSTLEVTCIITSLFIFLNSFSVSWNFNYCRRYFLWRQENTSLTLTGILKCVWEYDYAKSVMEMSSRVKQYCVTEVLYETEITLFFSEHVEFYICRCTLNREFIEIMISDSEDLWLWANSLVNKIHTS